MVEVIAKIVMERKFTSESHWEQAKTAIKNKLDGTNWVYKIYTEE